MALDIYTDYKNIIYFIITKILNKRQIRWAEIFEKYKFTIYYILKKNNNKANIFSRRSNLIKKKTKSILAIKIALRRPNNKKNLPIKCDLYYKIK